LIEYDKSKSVSSTNIVQLTFLIAIIMIIYQTTNQNIFWTGIILLFVGLIWCNGILYYDKQKIKKEFR